MTWQHWQFTVFTNADGRRSAGGAVGFGTAPPRWSSHRAITALPRSTADQPRSLTHQARAAIDQARSIVDQAPRTVRGALRIVRGALRIVRNAPRIVREGPRRPPKRRESARLAASVRPARAESRGG